MPQSNHCPKCSGAMAEGFVLDATHGAMTVSSWIAGAPEKSVWTGVKLSGRPRSQITTWRCRSCGFLEHYAPASPDRSHEAAQRRQGLTVVALVLATLLVIAATVLILR